MSAAESAELVANGQIGSQPAPSADRVTLYDRDRAWPGINLHHDFDVQPDGTIYEMQRLPVDTDLSWLPEEKRR